MQLYLPIAELSLNLFMLIGLGGAVGFLSGLFGVGGGFLLTPMLIFFLASLRPLLLLLLRVKLWRLRRLARSLTGGVVASI